MIVALPIILMLIAAVVFMTNLPLLVTSADVILKNSTTLAVRAAASQFEIGKADTGNETPKIDYIKARASFESILASNLELDNNLVPKGFSSFADMPSYKLLIHNGEDGIIYEYDGQITESQIAGQDFPIELEVSEQIGVVLNSPGVVAVVEAVPRLISEQNKPCSRWAAAMLVKDSNANWKAVLQGGRDI